MSSDSQLNLGVKHEHIYISKDDKSEKKYAMHPKKNINGPKKDLYPISNKRTRRRAYVDDKELSQLFAIDAFEKFGIIIRMLPSEKYPESAPSLQPGRSDVIEDSIFSKLVQSAEKNGLDPSLILKLAEIGIAIPLAKFSSVEHESSRIAAKDILGRVQDIPDAPEGSEADNFSSTDVTVNGGPIDERFLREVLARRGQPKFRNDLLNVYAMCCCITRCSVVELLEAAHIDQHSEGGDYSVTNGLLLRADIHTLFDLHLLSIDDHLLVRLSECLVGSEYETLQGKKMAAPDSAAAPNKAALQRHYEAFLTREKARKI